MIGDEEIIRGSNHLTTVICSSFEATVMLIKKEEFLKIRMQSEESWASIIQYSNDISKSLQKNYKNNVNNGQQVIHLAKDD